MGEWTKDTGTPNNDSSLRLFSASSASLRIVPHYSQVRNRKSNIVNRTSTAAGQFAGVGLVTGLEARQVRIAVLAEDRQRHGPVVLDAPGGSAGRRGRLEIARRSIEYNRAMSL